MPDLTLLDSDILIDAGRGIKDAIEYVERIEMESTLAIGTVTQMELIVGCHNKAELRNVEQFLKRFKVIKLSEQISDVAVDLLRRYRLSHGLLMPDALIAATAISLDISFATKNQRDYRFIEELRLLPYKV